MHVTFATEPAPGHVNEDFVLATPDVAVVLDGAGLPEGTDTGCIHGVPWYVRNLGTRYAQLLTTEPATSMTHALAQAIRDVTASHAGTCDPANPNSPSSTVAAIRIVDGRLEWLVLADSTIVFDTTYGIEVITDQRAAQAVQAQREAIAATAIGSAAHSQNRRQLVTAERRIRNVPDGYWVAANEPRPAYESLTGSLQLHLVRRAALLTDGATRPVDRFGDMTWPESVDLLRGQGPSGLLDRVRALEGRDPDGEVWPRSKRHDDATCALIHLV